MTQQEFKTYDITVDEMVPLTQKHLDEFYTIIAVFAEVRTWTKERGRITNKKLEEIMKKHGLTPLN